MTSLISGTVRIDIEHKRPTLRTIEELTVWKSRLVEQAKKVTPQSVEVMIKLLELYPELAQMASVTGNVREDYITERARELNLPDETEARTYAIEEAQKKIVQMASDNPQIARALFFPDIVYGEDSESIRLGIECIKATANLSGVTVANAELIQSDISSDFWQDADGKAVADFCNNFCKSIK